MGLAVKNKSNIRDAFEAECTPEADSSRLALRHGFSPVCVCGYMEDESQTADAVAASALGPLNPDKWWMHADEHREAAKRERLEIEKSTGKGDCRGAARAPHWPVFIGVITPLQALWHLETLSHRAWIITHRDRLSSLWTCLQVDSSFRTRPESQVAVALSPYRLPSSVSLSVVSLPSYLCHDTCPAPSHPFIPPNAQATSAIRHLATGLQPPTFNRPTGRFLVCQNRSVIRFLE
jgi:hypothetical protein